MDVNINLKITIEETPALINCFSAFCSTIERCTQLLLASDRDVSFEVETEVPKKALPEVKPASNEVPAEAPTASPEPVSAPAPKKYTLKDFQEACAKLMASNADNTSKLFNIIRSLGAEKLSEVPEDKFDELAEQLRALGADL